MLSDLFSGASYVLRGARLALRPELRRFVLVPMGINVLVFTLAIWFGISQFDGLMGRFFPSGDSWWTEYVRTALWVIFTVIVLVVLFFAFTVLANLIGAPFNGLLSEKVESFLTGRDMQSSGGLGSFVSTILPSLWSELKKLIYVASLGAAVFLLLLIPGLAILSPFLWGLYTAWMLAAEYTAYPMENHSMYFSQARRELKRHRPLALGFGLAVMVMTVVPGTNFFVMPAAVSGATALWVERMKPKLMPERGQAEDRES